MDSILYTPVFLKTPLIDSNKLITIFKNNCNLHENKFWNFWTVKFKPYITYDERWNNRYTNDNIEPIWDTDFKYNFPECILFLHSLPFKKITHINLLEQIKDIPLHIDYHSHEKVYKNQLCYKWLILRGEEDSFYIETHNKQIKFINPPNNYHCFCIQESRTKHGAIKKNKEKLIMSIFGELDTEKHKKIIEISNEKFNEHCISE